VAAVSYLYLNSNGVTFPHFITPVMQNIRYPPQKLHSIAH